MPPLNEVKRDINNLVRLPKDESYRSLSNERPIGLMETNSMSRKRLNLKRIDEQLAQSPASLFLEKMRSAKDLGLNSEIQKGNNLLRNRMTNDPYGFSSIESKLNP